MRSGRGGSRHFALEEIAPGVEVARAIDGGFALSNGTIVDLGGVTVVFDSMLTPSAGAALARAAARRTGRKPDWLINSHHHGDHCRGNSSFPGAHILSSRVTRDLIRDHAHAALIADRSAAKEELAALRGAGTTEPPRDRALLEGWFRGIRATRGNLPIPAPDVVVASDVTLHGSRRSLRVLTFGGGHSPSDVLAYLPDERIVLMGDLLTVGYHPSLPDGNPKAWLRILGRVLALGIDRAVPGHGGIGGAPDIRQIQVYLRSLEVRARALAREGLRKVPAQECEAPPPFEDWKFSRFYAENLQFVLGRVRRRADGRS